jgi:serine protease Do
MIKQFFTLVFFCMGNVALAQNNPIIEEVTVDSTPTNKRNLNEQKVVTVRIKGDKAKEQKYTIEIDGNKIKVNGKDIADMKDIDVTIGNNRIFMNRVGPRSYQLRTLPKGKLEELRLDADALQKHQSELHSRIMQLRGGNGALLGIGMEKVEDGIKISNVTEASAAEKAGLKEGDIITKINGKKVLVEMDITKMVSAEKPGAEMDITYKRNGKEQSTKAILGERKDMTMFAPLEGMPGDFNMPQVFEMPNMPNFDFKFDGDMPDVQVFKNGDWKNGNGFSANNGPKLGVSLKETESGNGLEVINVTEGSVAAKAGLQKGDVVTKVAGNDVNDIKDVKKLIGENKDKSFDINYLRNGKAEKVTVKFPKKLKEADM